jgi:hypothetical protein
MTYSGQDNPQGVQGHLAPDPVRDGIQADHPNELAEGLHCAPEGSVVCVESHFTLAVPEAKVVSEALVCNDVSCAETDRVGWECAMDWASTNSPLRLIWYPSAAAAIHKRLQTMTAF